VSANFLEELATQYYEYKGYFVRRIVNVGKLAKGGYEGELDVVAFHPVNNSLIHIEATMDAESWRSRELQFERKFAAGTKYIPSLFPGMNLPNSIEQIILLGYGTNKNHPTLGTAKVVTLAAFIREIMIVLGPTSMAQSAVPEAWGLIRCLQAVSDSKQEIFT